MSFDSITTILFDLDGTLLPMDQDQFATRYFELFGQHCASLGYDAERTSSALMAGFMAMMNNDGSSTNKGRFDRVFSQESQIDSDEFNQRFAPFYDHQFQQLRAVSRPSVLSAQILSYLHRRGYELILATSPLFPRPATLARSAWAGLDPSLFSQITTYESCRYTKPHLGYYRSILEEAGRSADQCMMVGNDVEEDMVVQVLGIDTYLVTDCLINRHDRDLTPFRRGSLEDYYLFCKEHL